MVCRSQTVEDGQARTPPVTTLHGEGTPQEFICIAIPVKQPWSPHDMDRQLVIRASQHTGDVTAALEKI